ncbi:MAG TPA: hypothetical protein VLH41_08595 [Thermoanaerobaculia bacterium]|nr:hypothetical protein [Thermoanaerobaculia bacterium]
MSGTPAEELRYWRARAGEFEKLATALRDRLAALAAVVPTDLVPLLTADPARIREEGLSGKAVIGLEEGTALRAAHVAEEVPLLWRRLEVEDSRRT